LEHEVTASLETLVIAAYVFAEALSIPRSGPKGKVTDAELIALAVAQAAMGVPSDRQFLGLVGKALPGFFPYLPDQSQFNRRLRRLGPWLSAVQLGVAELIASGEVRLRLLRLQVRMGVGREAGPDDRCGRGPGGL
jgi:hypothetical protein